MSLKTVFSQESVFTPGYTDNIFHATSLSVLCTSDITVKIVKTDLAQVMSY